METEHESEVVEEQEMRHPGVGLFCFFDHDRACSPDCMAFVQNPNPKTVQVSELSAQQAHCAIVTGVERTGRNLAILAGAVGGLLKKQSIQDADKQRQSQFQTPANPFTKEPNK